MGTDTDQARWAEAQSILDGAPTESAEQRLRRWRRLTALLAGGMVLVGLAVAVAAATWFGDEPGSLSGGGSRWREAVGLVVLCAGFVVVLVAFVVQWRGYRRQRVWRSPFVVLTNRQRRELWDQVHGKAPLEPKRVPLARHLATGMGALRVIVVLQLGALLMFTGVLISSPSPGRLGMLVVFGVVTTAAVPTILRNERRARRFLAEHPEPGSAA